MVVFKLDAKRITNAFMLALLMKFHMKWPVEVVSFLIQALTHVIGAIKLSVKHNKVSNT